MNVYKLVDELYSFIGLESNLSPLLSEAKDRGFKPLRLEQMTIVTPDNSRIRRLGLLLLGEDSSLDEDSTAYNHAPALLPSYRTTGRPPHRDLSQPRYPYPEVPNERRKAPLTEKSLAVIFFGKGMCDSDYELWKCELVMSCGKKRR